MQPRSYCRGNPDIYRGEQGVFPVPKQKKIKEAYANAVKRTGKCVGFRPDDAAKILRCRGPDGVNLANKYSSNRNEDDF